MAVGQREQITQIGVAGVTAALRSRCDQLSAELLTSVRRRLRRPPGPPGILGAVFVPCDVVRQAAVAVADHEGPAEDRVEDAVKGFLPGPDPDAALLLKRFADRLCRVPPLHGRDEAVRGGVRRSTPTTSFCSAGNSPHYGRRRT